MSTELSQTKGFIIGQMIASLQRGEDRAYYVGLVGYFIEGCPYSASGLSVDSVATPSIRQTIDGFVCDAFFPPDTLQQETVEANGIVKKVVRGMEFDLVPVLVEVKLKDIWSVAERIEGVQHSLIVDEETLDRRLALFRGEREEWLDGRNRSDGSD